MSIPGFAAEASVYKTLKCYQVRWITGQVGKAILPAQRSDCFGSIAQCRENFCGGLSGRQHGLCWNACAQPTVCEPTCTWHIEAGSFSRFCYKRLSGTPGVSLGCYEDCI